MKCINCGVELPDGSKFCTECGTPQPQNKSCPNCKTELPLTAKFCFNCGYKFAGASAGGAGLSMGDKNVIAGDVIGHKEEYKVSGNATIVKNEDETKKVVRCHICGKNTPIINTHTCPVCGESVCDSCYDNIAGMCNGCKENFKASGENEYREALRKVFTDGRVDINERRSLQALQTKLGLSDNRAKELENEIKFSNAKAESFTTVEKLNMEDSAELFYGKGDVDGAYNLMHPVYEKHQYSEKVLDLYLPILEEYDSDKALEIIEGLNADMLTAYLVKIDIYTKTDLSEAERCLDNAESIWSDSLLLKCRRVNWLFKMYRETGRSMFYDEISQIVDSMADGNDKLERTWKARAESIREAGKDNLSHFTENECKQKNIYMGLANSSLFIEKIGGLTEKPILLEPGTDGTAGTSGKYVLFGDWPQTIKADDVSIDESKTYKVNGRECYKGSDGCYYVKAKAKPCEEVDNPTFSNGENIVKNNNYYFKMESIKWRILDNNYGGGKLLLSEQALTAGCYDTHDDHNKYDEIKRTIKGKTVHANNYEYSRIRAYLNGLDGSNYDVEDYRDRGFINKAFSEKAISKIRTVTVDNSEETILGRGEDKDEDYEGYKYVCNNTQDKVFLLSENEVTKESYIFDKYDRYIGDNNGTKTSSRIRKVTDYSKAIGVWYDTDEESENNVSLWLRSPCYFSSTDARGVDTDGDASNYSSDSIYISNRGVVPALSISF